MTEPPEVFRGIERQLDYETAHGDCAWYYLFRDQGAPYARLLVESVDRAWSVRMYLTFKSTNVELTHKPIYYVDNAKNIDPRDLEAVMQESVDALRRHLRRAKNRLDALDDLPDQPEPPTLWERLETP